MTRTPDAFLRIDRTAPPKRPVEERIRDSREVDACMEPAALREQASRCMDCGIPFCHQGCPLGNRIPEWNELVSEGDWKRALDELHATNNFPEFTGKTCPAPCEQSCVLNIDGEPVNIKAVERHIVQRGWAEGWIQPKPSQITTGRHVGVVGSGPAGLACAQQLARVGHRVTVYERDDRAGGLLRYGIPDFKLEKVDVERRVQQLQAEGVDFRLGVEVGRDITAQALITGHDALCLAVGAQQPRELQVPGMELQGVHYAMDYLTQQNRRVAGDTLQEEGTGRNSPIHASGKRVVILGGGDTGADCLGTAHRQGAAEVRHFHYKPAPPESRTEDMPWPWWPMVAHPSSSHEEGGIRGWSVVTKGFRGENGQLTHMDLARVQWVEDEGKNLMREVEQFSIEVDLVLIAVGFEGPGAESLLSGLGVSTSPNGFPQTDAGYRTSQPGVFCCGDARRGASLVVWAIWEGRETARTIDDYLNGETRLPTLPNHYPLL